MASIASVGTALPEHTVHQKEVRALARDLFAEHVPDIDRYLDVLDHAGVDTRHLAAPPDWVLEGHGWEARNERYLEVAVDLAMDAARDALDAAGVPEERVDGVVFVSSTGLATPSVDARMMHRMRVPMTAVRVPLWGLGCAGGVAGLNRARDLVEADSERVVLVVALELCSLNFLVGDRSVKNLVAAALFGDGAAATVVAGADADVDGEGPELVAGASRLWEDSLDVMGWNVEDEGLGVVFSPGIPDLVVEGFRPYLESFLEDAGRSLPEVDRYVLHPGGPKVIEAYQEALDLDEGALEDTWRVLADHGNMSSPTVLFVLDEVMDRAQPGDVGVLAAWGPGFSGDLALVEW